jgi:hypothetical protein
LLLPLLLLLTAEARKQHPLIAVSVTASTAAASAVTVFLFPAELIGP